MTTSPATSVEGEETPRVVVVGAGFAGLAAARRLVGTETTVTVVDRHNFHTFLPLLYQVATAGLDPADVAYPVRSVFGGAKNVGFRHGRVTGVDLEARVVRLADGDELGYDYLVVATGAAAQFFGIPGAAANALPLYTLADARRLRNRLLSVLEEADAHPESHDFGAPVFVVVGAGATGVETAGALVELLDVCVRHDRLRIDPERTRVVLVDAGTRVLSSFRPGSSRYAADTLVARGVEIRLGTQVASVDDRAVYLADGTVLQAAAVIWAAGVTVDATLAATLDVAHGAGGRVEVCSDLSLEGRPEVFVVGDAAAVPLRLGGEPCAQVAQVAIQSGRYAAAAIQARIEHRDPAPFRYKDKGIMATIGRRAAVTQLPRGPIIRGTPGWLAWLGLHLVYLIGFRNRLRVLLSWLWRYFDWRSGPRLIVGDVETDS